VERRGTPIEDYGLRHSVNPGISYSPYFLGLEACEAAHLDMYKWNEGLYPKEFMETVVAWYQAHEAIKMHAEDAVITKQEQEAKRKAKH
jgi:hypothetical protein